MVQGFVGWLVAEAVGPAAVSIPVGWTAHRISEVVRSRFRRFGGRDGLRQFVRAAVGDGFDLTKDEYSRIQAVVDSDDTWQRLSSGTVDDLVVRLESCLAPGSRAAAEAIARGLLWHVAGELDPPMFQRVLLSTLHRMDANHATRLDWALADLHSDLVARLALQDQVDQSRFETLLGHLRQHLPSDHPAGPTELLIYLEALIDWLNDDPWPQTHGLGPRLKPADLERPVRISWEGSASKDVDIAHSAYRRMVILGGPGSGKTWLAKRTARVCAETARQALADGESLDSIEIPLYTTCSHLGRNDSDDIRTAAVLSALNQMPDLHGTRVTDSIRSFFASRNDGVLLVLDGLDEAHDPDTRIRQADTLPWRILLTSRPSSWTGQLPGDPLDPDRFVHQWPDEDHRRIARDVLDRLRSPWRREPDPRWRRSNLAAFLQQWYDEEDQYIARQVIDQVLAVRQVGEVQPLRYPEDVEAFVESWFAGDPATASQVVGQLRRRRDLREAATVPLMLASFCILGGESLPRFRRHLFNKVINRLLSGPWHPGRPQIDRSRVLEQLREWTWCAVGEDDNFLASPPRLTGLERDALDHLAVPVGPEDFDTGRTPRRFLHMSLREHLVATYVAGLPISEAVEVLLPHLWFDPEWKYIAPAAVAAHPERSKLLSELIDRAGGAGNINAIDAGGEFRRFLLEVAAETDESDWSPGIAELITSARLDYAHGHQLRDILDTLDRPSHWPSSEPSIHARLVRSAEFDLYDTAEHADRLRNFGLSSDELASLRAQMLSRLTNDDERPWGVTRLADGIRHLDPTPEDLGRIHDALLQVAGAGDPRAVSVALRNATTPARRSAVLASIAAWISKPSARIWDLPEVLPEIARQPGDISNIVDALLDAANRPDDLTIDAALDAAVVIAPPPRYGELLGVVIDRLADRRGYLSPRRFDHVRRLAVTPDLRHTAIQLLVDQLPRFGESPELLSAMLDIATSASDRAYLRSVLSAYLADGGLSPSTTALLVMPLITLADDPRQRDEIRVLLRDRFSREQSASLTYYLVTGLARLDAGHDLRPELIDRLARTTNGAEAGWLLDALRRLKPTTSETSRVFDLLCTRLMSWLEDAPLRNAVITKFSWLATTPEDRNRAKSVLIDALADVDEGARAALLAAELRRYQLTLDERDRASAMLFGHLDSYNTSTADELIENLASMGLRPGIREPTLRTANKILAEMKGSWGTPRLLDRVIALGLTEEERRVTIRAVLTPGASISRLLTDRLLEQVRRLADSEETSSVACHSLFAWPMPDDEQDWQLIIEWLAELAMTQADRRRACELIFERVAATPKQRRRRVLDQLQRLAPTTAEVTEVRSALLNMLADRDVKGYTLVEWLARFDPAAADLAGARDWARPPTDEVLHAVRRNSTLEEWLEVLPQLAWLSDLPTYRR